MDRGELAGHGHRLFRPRLPLAVRREDLVLFGLQLAVQIELLTIMKQQSNLNAFSDFLVCNLLGRHSISPSISHLSLQNVHLEVALSNS